MKKIVISIILGFLAVNSFAQERNNLADRFELIKKYGTVNAIPLGWYTGAVGSIDIGEMNNNYLGLSNYLSAKMGNLAILEVLKSDREVAEEALVKNFEVIYTSSLIGSQLANKGWKPILVRTESFTPVILALKNNKVLKQETDVPNAKILGSFGVTVPFMQYSLIQNKVLTIEKMQDTPNFQTKKISQESLIGLLNQGQVDGVIVRDVVAQKAMKDNEKYTIISKGKISPGHMIMVSPNVSAGQASAIKSAFLSLNQVNKNSTILKAFDGHKEGEEIFREIIDEDLIVINDVFNKTKQNLLEIKNKK
jgi:hypothetical protein